MRLSPRSLPLQSNHSCNVCAPPPDPPPPIAMASRPSDSGIFASVEARCTCAVFPSCESTARTTLSRRESAGQLACWSISDLYNLTVHGLAMDIASAGSVLCCGTVFSRHGLLDGKPQGALQTVNLRHRRGSQVDSHGRGFRNRIHRRAAPDHTHVKRSFRRGWHRRLGEDIDRTSEDDDRTRRAKIAPGMAARPAHDDLEATAAQGLRNHRVRASAIDDEAVGNCVPPCRSLRNAPHAPEVAFTLLAYIPDKQKGHAMGNIRSERVRSQPRAWR